VEVFSPLRTARTAGRVLTRSVPVAAALLLVVATSAHAAHVTFTVVPSPNAGDEATGNRLRAVKAFAANNVWAVGDTTKSDFSSSRTLIESWNGSAWSVVASPSPSPFYNELRDIDGRSANDVWAVGRISTEAFGFGSKTLVQRFDGKLWSTVPSPNPGASDSVLAGVATLSNGEVWAVGHTNAVRGGNSQTLTMRWTGTAWATVPSPNPDPHSFLTAVGGTGPNDVWAVGVSSGSIVSGGEWRTLTMHWDGVRWTIVPSPNPLQVSQLFGVVALAPDDVWAVGSVFQDGHGPRPHVMHWDGTAWNLAETPLPEAGLYDVAASSPSDVWAVGFSTVEFERTTVMHFDGATWTSNPSPSPELNPELMGVSAADDNVWAVGNHSDIVNSRLVPRTLTMLGKVG